MSQYTKKINLSQIRLETDFRKKEKDLSLELSITRDGLRVPLIIEKESENQFVLVEGYRRFYALKFLGKVDAECIIEKLSSEDERIIKRLSTEFHSKKRTAYQLERMITKLLESNRYDTILIASLCNVTEQTIKKYVQGREVKPDWISRGEKSGVGRHTLTDIQKLKISKELQGYIANKYIDRDINKNAVDVIKKTTKEKMFQDLPDEYKKESIVEIIEKQSKDYVKEIVNEKALKVSYNKNSHMIMYKLSLSLLSRLENIFRNKNFTDYLSSDQKILLINLLDKLRTYLVPSFRQPNFQKRKRSNVIEKK